MVQKIGSFILMHIDLAHEKRAQGSRLSQNLGGTPEWKFRDRSMRHTTLSRNDTQTEY